MLNTIEAQDLRQMARDIRGSRGNQHVIESMIELETTRTWGYPNSRILGGEASYNRDFKGVIPREFQNIKEYIERSLVYKRGRAVGLELGGIGSNLFGGFTPGFFRKTAGVSLTDFRGKLSPDMETEGRLRNHKVIEGNFLDPKTQEEVSNFLSGDQIDLIVHRMIGGRSSLPNEVHVLAHHAAYWYRRLAIGGIMLLEVPKPIEPYLYNWENDIKEKYEGRIEAQYRDSPNNGTFLRIRKLSGDPASLPLLPIHPSSTSRVRSLFRI